MTKENTEKTLSEEEKKPEGPKSSTGGYSERYGGGYASGSCVAPEIRDAANNLSDEMKKQAEKMGIKLTQSSGYLNFGAGIQIHKPDYVITVPTAFEWREDFQSREITAYSRDCADDIYSSPLLLEAARVKLVKPMTENELELRQKAAAEITESELSVIELYGIKIFLATDDNDTTKRIYRITALIKDGAEIFTLKLTFSRKIDNADEITKRIYYSLHFV